jgi:glycosyltransferase involved in cell wall biosynthesis
MTARRADLQARHGLDGARVIMTLARLPEKERYKGVDEVLKCMPALLRDIPNLKYLVAGEGDDRPRLMQKAQSMGLAEHVVFTGMIAEADKADYFRLADAFVMPGRGEGFGFVFLEALACGVPVVGSQLDGSREALRDGTLGELADPTDLESIRVCILRALASPPGIPPGLSYFDWPHFQARLAAAVRQLIHPRKGSA